MLRCTGCGIYRTGDNEYLDGAQCSFLEGERCFALTPNGDCQGILVNAATSDDQQALLDADLARRVRDRPWLQ